MQEGRGIGLAAKIAAYALQEEGGAGRGLDTVDANRALGLPDDAREYGAVADVLRDLGLMDGGGDGAVTRGGASSGGACAPLLLLSNNPRKAEKLAEAGVHLAGRRPCALPPLSEFAARYMRTKAERMGHDFPAGLF
jgi:GTP cyclohydrolase II